MFVSNNKLIISVICRTSSQNNEEFYLFLSNFVKLLTDMKKPYLPVSQVIWMQNYLHGDANKRLITDYKKADTSNVRKFFDLNNLEKPFWSLKVVHIFTISISEL